MIPTTSAPNGRVIYCGPSQLDGSTTIVCIVTGMVRRSDNPKTGPMLQTWILRQDIDPHTAAQSGLDSPICGDCPLTKLISVSGIRIRPRRCYVATQNAPLQIWRKFRSGDYSPADSLRDLGAGESIRVGAYGDPLAVPYRVWRDLLADATTWTGYTHSWRIGRFWRFRRYLMASCETQDDRQEAKRRGWRTFTTSAAPNTGEILCPALQGKTCFDCGACNGSRGKRDQRVDIVIPPHGGQAIMSAWERSRFVTTA